METQILACFDHGCFHLIQSWRELSVHQQPEYPDAAAVKEAADELARMPPLVFAGECRNLQARLAKCATGDSFWLQGKFVTPSTSAIQR